MQIFGFQKGSISVKLGKFNFAPGETIAGTVELQLKNPIAAKELSIEIVGEQTTFDARTRHRTTSRVFAFKQPLDGEKEYSPAAGPLTYPFQMNVPGNISGPTLPEGAIGAFLKTAQMFTGGSGPIQWHLVARLAVPGFDITKKVSINVT